MGSIRQIPRDVLRITHGVEACIPTWMEHPPPSADKGTPPWTVFESSQNWHAKKLKILPSFNLSNLGKFWAYLSLSNNCCLQISWATTFIDSWGCFGGASQREQWKVASRWDWPSWESPRIFQLGRSSASYSLDTWPFQQFDQLNIIKS